MPGIRWSETTTLTRWLDEERKGFFRSGGREEAKVLRAQGALEQAKIVLIVVDQQHGGL